MFIRDRPRFVDQVGHQTMHEFMGETHFFTKQCHPQDYQKFKSLQKISFIKVDLLVKYSLQKKKIRKIRLIFDAKK